MPVPRRAKQWRSAGLLSVVACATWMASDFLDFCAGGPSTRSAARTTAPTSSAILSEAILDGPRVQATSSGATSACAVAGAAVAAVFLLQRRGQRDVVSRAAGPESLDRMTKIYEGEIKEIRRRVTDLPKEFDDVKLLRFALQHKGDPAAAADNVKEVLKWRAGDGASIVASASAAIEKASAGGKWDNTHVFNAAPNADRIGKYITPSQMVVVSTDDGDLVTCIRASVIDSESLMKEVSEKEMEDFFIYAREVNSLVAEQRTRSSGKIVKLIAANDLTGISKFPDQKFQNALTGSAKKAVTLYPGYSGATILLNLPWIARMLVSVLTPLFPGAVREKIKFSTQPMEYMTTLEDITKNPIRSQFVKDLQLVLQS